VFFSQKVSAFGNGNVQHPVEELLRDGDCVRKGDRGVRYLDGIDPIGARASWTLMM